jgi:ubiquinone biosynthesis protein
MTAFVNRGRLFSSLPRLRFILTTVFSFGGRLLIARLRLLYLIPWRLRITAFLGKGGKEEVIFPADRHVDAGVFSPPVLRRMLERLGPTFVKLGQVMSLRPDVVGETLSRELSKLQSDVAPFPFDEVERIIVEEFGEAPSVLFSSLDRQPAAAASLAQVHRGFLKDGTEVAVKVQRPGIRKTIEQDIRILLYLARLMEKRVPEVRPYNPVQVIEEFADWTRRELNFAAEGHNAERFRFAFRENPHIKIPLIYWELTSPRVLTMEYIRGVRADDPDGIERQGLSRRQLALRGVEAQLQQILIDGFFHADPHPGNSFALEGNILCFYDFGMVGYLTQKQRRELLSSFLAFTNKDVEEFLNHFLHLAKPLQGADLGAFQRDGAEILNQIFFSPTDTSVAWVFFRLIHRAAVRGVSFPSDLALFAKAMITTEAMGLALYPDFDFDRHLAPFIKKAFEAYVDPTRLRTSFANDIIDYVSLLQDLPTRAQAILKSAEDRQDQAARRETEQRLWITRELRAQSIMRLAEMSLLAAAFLVALTVIAGVGLFSSAIFYGSIGFFLAVFLISLFVTRTRE